MNLPPLLAKRTDPSNPKVKMKAEIFRVGMEAYVVSDVPPSPVVLHVVSEAEVGAEADADEKEDEKKEEKKEDDEKEDDVKEDDVKEDEKNED